MAGYFKLIWDGMSILVTLLDAFTMPVSLAWDTYAGMAESWTQLQRAWYLHTVFPLRNIKSQVVRAMVIYHHIPISHIGDGHTSIGMAQWPTEGLLMVG